MGAVFKWLTSNFGWVKSVPLDCFRLVATGKEMLVSIEENKRTLPARLYLSRIISNFEATFPLFEKSYGIQGSYVARTSFEDLVTLNFLYRTGKDEAEHDRFFKSELLLKYRAYLKLQVSKSGSLSDPKLSDEIEAAKQYKEEFFNEFYPDAKGDFPANYHWSGKSLPKRISAISHPIRQEKLLEEYETQYRALCEIVHGSMEVWHQLVSESEPLKVKIRFEQGDQEKQLPVMTAGNYLVTAMRDVAEVLKVDGFNEKINALDERLGKAWNN